MDTFLRFDHWTLTKPEFSGAVFRVIVTFTRKKIVTLMYFWDLIPEPWPNQSSPGQSLQSSSLSPEINFWYWYFLRFDRWTLTKPEFSGAVFTGIVTFTWKKFVILIHLSDLTAEPWPNQSSIEYCDIDIFVRFDNWTLAKPEFSGAVFTASSLSPEKVLWYGYIFEIWSLNLDQARVVWGSL